MAKAGIREEGSGTKSNKTLGRAGVVCATESNRFYAAIVLLSIICSRLISKETCEKTVIRTGWANHQVL